MVLCGDSYGRVSIWKLNDYLDNSVQQNVPEIEPNVSYSLSTAWKELRDLPCGIIDTLV